MHSIANFFIKGRSQFLERRQALAFAIREQASLALDSQHFKLSGNDLQRFHAARDVVGGMKRALSKYERERLLVEQLEIRARHGRRHTADALAP